ERTEDGDATVHCGGHAGRDRCGLGCDVLVEDGRFPRVTELPARLAAHDQLRWDGVTHVAVELHADVADALDHETPVGALHPHLVELPAGGLGPLHAVESGGVLEPGEP